MHVCMCTCVCWVYVCMRVYVNACCVVPQLIGILFLVPDHCSAVSSAAGQPINEALLRKKDANIKKNSSFVKKLVSLAVGATLA